MTEPVFVDTTVLVYRFDTAEPEKQRRCELWLDELWDRGTGRVSIQVLQELYVTLTSKLPHSLAPADAQIVATAQILDCRYLLTEDLSHDQTLDGVTVIDPFRTTPGKPA